MFQTNYWEDFTPKIHALCSVEILLIVLSFSSKERKKRYELEKCTHTIECVDNMTCFTGLNNLKDIILII